MIFIALALTVLVHCLYKQYHIEFSNLETAQPLMLLASIVQGLK